MSDSTTAVASPILGTLGLDLKRKSRAFGSENRKLPRLKENRERVCEGVRETRNVSSSFSVRRDFPLEGILLF